MTPRLPPPPVDRVPLPGGRTIRVVRDDTLAGGTKRRMLPMLMTDCNEAVYASPAEGFAQVALAIAAAVDVGIASRVFVAARKQMHPNTIAAMAAGAKVNQVRPGYMTVVRRRAADYCAQSGARLLPFGLDTPDVVDRLAQVARQATKYSPQEVWCVAGSGVLARSLERAWPDAALHCVQIGRVLREEDIPERADIYVAPEPFSRGAALPPPFPSCPNYDAKAWRFMLQHAADDALFWNVAA